MTTSYELALLGQPTDVQVSEVTDTVERIIGNFGLRLHHEVGWRVRPNEFKPDEKRTAAAAFFGGAGVPLGAAASLMADAIPCVPIVSATRNASGELPPELRELNALAYSDGPERVATALLECAGLLPRQRRVFISYRRDEASAAALQLFEALSARLYDVFLDTRGVAPGDHFQEVLWHRLSDSDVVVMLDTLTYFDSRWTAAEFGRALAKGIAVLRVGWPGVAASPRVATAASVVALTVAEVDAVSGKMSAAALGRVADQVEIVRSESIAVRRLNLVSKLSGAIVKIGGTVAGLGIGGSLHLQLADGRKLVAHPTVGVPTAETLHQARTLSPSEDVAVVYDHIGLGPNWLSHLDWLGENIAVPRWLRITEAAWDLADWEKRR